MTWGFGNIGSGGSGNVYGIIVVNYPSGSTVTINTNATKKDISSTQREYYVKEPGTYTITSTNGTQTTSNSVTINATTRFVITTLSYTMYIINGSTAYFGFTPSNLRWNGNYVARNPDVGTGANYYLVMPSLSGGSSQAGYSGAWYTNGINLSAYNRVRIEYSISVTGGNDYKKTRAFIYLNNGTPSTVESAAVKASYDYAGSSSGQSLTIYFGKGAYSSAQLGVGLCNTNFGVGGTLTINRIYAYNE